MKTIRKETKKETKTIPAEAKESCYGEGCCSEQEQVSKKQKSGSCCGGCGCG